MFFRGIPQVQLVFEYRGNILPLTRMRRHPNELWKQCCHSQLAQRSTLASIPILATLADLAAFTATLTVGVRYGA